MHALPSLSNGLDDNIHLLASADVVAVAAVVVVVAAVVVAVVTSIASGVEVVDTVVDALDCVDVVVMAVDVTVASAVVVVVVVVVVSLVDVDVASTDDCTTILASSDEVFVFSWIFALAVSVTDDVATDGVSVFGRTFFNLNLRIFRLRNS